jgi:hypothetical protein
MTRQHFIVAAWAAWTLFLACVFLHVAFAK